MACGMNFLHEKLRPVAQLAERRSPKPQVGGSIPSWPANYLNRKNDMLKSKVMFNELLLWFGIAFATIAAFLGTYYFKFSTPVLAMIWIGWLVLSLSLAFFTEKGKQAFLFAKESKVEMEKVVWPNRQEAIQTTSIVMLMVTITGFILWGIDSGMMWAIGKITHLG